MTATTTPLPVGTDIAESIGGKAFSRAILHDAAGADAMGAVEAAPAANTLLGRLKAVVDGITALVSHVDGIEGLLTALNGYVDGLEATLAAQATAVKQDESKAAIIDLGPAGSAVAIVPHNANALPSVARAIYVGTAGDITIRPAGGAADVVFKAMPAGSFLPVRVSHVRAAGTTAADLVGLA